MARNGSGTYSLPEDPFVFDTVISHTDVNSNFSDLATEITNSLDKDGQTNITGLLKLSVAVGQTANTGSVQGNNPITTMYYEIAVCGNSGDAVTLPAAVAGQLVIIVNNGANSADVFPASGDKIDGGSANAAFALAAGANALFICQDGTDWDSLGGGFFTPSSTTTLSNKTIDLDANTVTGTLAEFNTALQSESFASLGGSETLVSKTLTAPVLNDPTFDVSVGVTAHTGSSQGDGAISSTFVEISVCANAGDAVTLPSAAAGKLVIIANNGANSCDVFPASGDAIDGASANAAKALAAGANRIHICQDGTDWDTIGAEALGADVVSGSNLADDACNSEHYTDASIDTQHIATNQIDETLMKDAFVGDFTDATVTASDYFLHGDATDSGNTKKDTVQGIIDLVHGATVGLQTIWIPAKAMTPTNSNPCADIAVVETTAGRPDMHVLDFDKDADEGAQFEIAFPKSWDEGVVKFQVMWAGLAATTGVAWGLSGVSVPDNSTIDVAYGTAVVVTDDAQGAVEEMLVSPLSGNVTVAGAAADTATFFRIYRDVSDGNDDMAGDARLLGVKLFFTTDAENDA